MRKMLKYGWFCGVHAMPSAENKAFLQGTHHHLAPF
jgi:hypothetical protein